MDLSPAPALHSQVRCRSVALLIDGDNISPALAGKAVMSACRLGPVVVLRVYGDARKLGAWHDAPGFRVVHAHAGKNITDMLLTVEALELSFAGTIDGFALATSDRDFTPLAQSLRARGFPVLALTGPNAPEALRQSCTADVPLAPKPAAEPAPPPETTHPKPQETGKLHSAIFEVLKPLPLHPADFGKQMQARGFNIPSGAKTWRQYLGVLNGRIEIRGEGTEKRICLVDQKQTPA